MLSFLCGAVKAQVGSVSHVRLNIEQCEERSLNRYDQKVLRIEKWPALRQELVTDLYRFGFIDPTWSSDTVLDTLKVSVQVGQAYAWATVRMSEETARHLRKAGVNVWRWTEKPVSPRKMANGMEWVVRDLENRGFPFASAQFDSVQIEQGKVSGRLVVDPGPLVTIDSVILHGSLRIRETYVTNYLGIKEGSPYSEKNIQSISSNLSELQFLTENRPATVTFHKTETKVNLHLDARKASRFDGIVGFLPDETTGRILITGDVSLHLENALRQGEIIDLNWRKLQTNTQDLTAEAVAPFVLNSPLSPDGALKIYRRDTLFTDIFIQGGIRYIFTRNNYVRAFVDRQTTSLISTDQYESTTIVPPYLDRSIISYGLGFNLAKIDYRLNPSKGVEVKGEAAAGNKVIIENPNLPKAIYDSLTLQSLQIKSKLDAAYYISFIPRLVWHQRFLGGTVINDQVFNNEAYRIGGLKTLRGFDEESIFATTYAIARNELRYQIERNGYVFLLYDQAWYENTSLNRIGARQDRPYAFGAGVTFSTKAGIFTLSTAVGSQQGNPFLIRASKIHFGFLSLF